MGLLRFTSLSEVSRGNNLPRATLVFSTETGRTEMLSSEQKTKCYVKRCSCAHGHITSLCGAFSKAIIRGVVCLVML